MLALNYTIIPARAVIQVDICATWLHLGDAFLSAMRHPAAGSERTVFGNQCNKRGPYRASATTRNGER